VTLEQDVLPVPASNVVPVDFGSGPAKPAAIAPEKPSPLAKLSTRERRVWNYLVKALADYGLVHRTDAPLLMIVVRVFVQWLDAEEQLAELVVKSGSYIIKTPNGYEQPHQLYYVAKDLKRQLLQWLPEAALTIPSFAKLTEGGDELPKTPDMFEDPVEAFRNRKQALNGSTGL
jgi:phage terminase small subunit